MPWTLGLAIYVIIWWTLLFAVLPFGVKSQHEMNDVVPGSDPGAPARTHLGIKIVINTILAAVVWLAVYYAYARFLPAPG